MTETPVSNVPDLPQAGPLSQWLDSQGFDHTVLPPDHLGIERIAVEPLALPVVATALKFSMCRSPRTRDGRTQREDVRRRLASTRRRTRTHALPAECRAARRQARSK